MLECTWTMPKNVDEVSVFDDDDQFSSGKPADFNQLLMFQIGRINMAGSSEGLVYDKIKASAYNNAVEELEALLENHINEDRFYYADLTKRKRLELDDIKQHGITQDSLIIVRLSRVKFRCLSAVMGRHNLFPSKGITDEI